MYESQIDHDIKLQTDGAEARGSSPALEMSPLPSLRTLHQSRRKKLMKKSPTERVDETLLLGQIFYFHRQFGLERKKRSRIFFASGIYLGRISTECRELTYKLVYLRIRTDDLSSAAQTLALPCP